MNELLNIENLHISFAVESGELHAVRGVSLSLFEGETLALVGESGCGKSVTAKSILQLNPRLSSNITDGSIRLFDQEVTRFSAHQMDEIRGNKVGMVFQDPMSSLNPSMRIWAQVTDGLRKHKKLSGAQRRQEAIRLLKLVQLPEPELRSRQYPHQLSGGMRQRVMLAMALACEPKILIADEPTTALDVTIQAEILLLLKSLRQQLHMSTLFITHDLAVAASIADRIAVMYAGEIVESGPIADVFFNPHHPYTKALFQSHPAKQIGTGQELPFIQGALPDLTKPISGCAFAPRCVSCMPQCTKAAPVCKTVSQGHTVSCFLYNDTGVSEKGVTR